MRCMDALSFLILAVLAGGCASSLKHYNPRMGLLDRLAEMTPAYRSGPPRAAGNWMTRVEPAQEIKSERSPAAARAIARVSLQWPLRNVYVTSPFGRRGREFHEGIDLRAKIGTPVYAAHFGEVLYAGTKIHGYGRMIVLRHPSGLATIYAHNSRLLVHKGEWVRKGSIIAYSGESGHAHGPHLHFEVRRGITPINPLSVLPKPVLASHRLRRRGRVLAARER